MNTELYTGRMGAVDKLRDNFKKQLEKLQKELKKLGKKIDNMNKN
jgi:predicted transcriptional regulator